jgi:hypothetical protein
VTSEQRSRQDSVRTLAGALVLGGLLTIGIAVYLGFAVGPGLFAIALLALADFALAWALATGRIGARADRLADAEPSGDAAAEAELDPSYNPYVRED